MNAAQTPVLRRVRYACDVLVAYELALNVAELAALAKDLDEVIAQLINNGTGPEAMTTRVNVRMMEIEQFRSVLRDEKIRPMVCKTDPMKLLISNKEITLVPGGSLVGSEHFQ